MSRQKIMAICDTEAAYACRLMEYLEEKHSLPYEIHAFTSPEKLCAFAAERDVDILLISEAALDEQVETLPVERRVILTDGETAETEEGLRICKFQSAAAILAQVAEYSPETLRVQPERRLPADLKFYGVYAPSGGSQTTAFAIALAAVLAERKEVLYINLRNFSGLEQLSGDIFERTLGDLLYFFRRGVEDLPGRVRATIRRAGPVDYIPPATSPADLQEVSGAEWAELLPAILVSGEADCCVLELSDGVRDLTEVMGLCAHIFLPSTGDVIARAAAAQFSDCLRDMGQNGLLSRCSPVILPPCDRLEEGDLFRQAADGVFGACARRALTEERRGYGAVAGIEKPSDGSTGRKRRMFRRRHPRSDR